MTSASIRSMLSRVHVAVSLTDAIGSTNENILSTLLVNGSLLERYLPHFVYAFLECFT